MKITDVRVKLHDQSRFHKGVLAHCSITLDDEFAIHDIRVVRLREKIIVAMPCRKVTEPCPQCRTHNHLLARFCNDCGGQLQIRRGSGDPTEKPRFQVDLAHPIKPELRSYFERTILDAYIAAAAKKNGPLTEHLGPPQSDE